MAEEKKNISMDAEEEKSTDTGNTKAGEETPEDGVNMEKSPKAKESQNVEEAETLEDAEDGEEAAEEDADIEAQDSEEGAKAGEESASGKKEGFFNKKKKKDKRDEQIEDLTDRLKRQMAEFDNFRKRTEKEKSQMFDMGAKSVIEKILPVADNFERGLAAVPEEEKANGFVDGMDKVYKQLMTELETIGVKPIAAVGEEFNPEYHNAVMQVESEELESGMVAQELQRGYQYKDSVVRHSMVAVVQ